MRKALTVAIIAVMLFGSLALLPAPAKAETKTSTPTELTVLDVPFNSEEQVNKHFAFGYRLVTDTIQNLSYSYNMNENAAELTATYPQSGYLLLGGFTPALNTTIEFDIKISNPGVKGSGIRFMTDFFDFSILEWLTYYKIVVIYENSTGDFSYTVDVPQAFGLDWLHIQVIYSGENRTYHLVVSNATNVSETFVSIWNQTRQDALYTKQPGMLPPFFFVSPSNNPSYATAGTTVHIYMRNLKQTIPLESSKNVFGYVPQKKYAALGFDGPYNATIENALPALHKYNYKATWFFMQHWENHTSENTSGWNFTNMRDILADQEFGIHVSDSDYYMKTYNTTNTQKTVDEFKYLISKAEQTGWHNSSFVWTSEGNAYAWEYNDYFWEHWNIIGRKMWGHWESNQGYLSNHDVGLNVQRAAEHGWSWIAYTHQVRNNNSDITPEQFESFLANNSKNNIYVVGYFEYWSRYAAPWWVYGSLTEQDGKYKVTVNYNKFTVANGFKVAAKITGLGANTVVYDTTTGTYVHDFKVYDWGIVFEAHDGHTYEIYEDTSGGGAGDVDTGSSSDILASIGDFVVHHFLTIAFAVLALLSIPGRNWKVSLLLALLAVVSYFVVDPYISQWLGGG